MSRSLKKIPFIVPSVLRKVIKSKTMKRSVVRTKARSCTIIPDFVGCDFEVYNGRKYIPITVSEDMIGHKLGEFSHTRTFYGHAADKKSIRKK